MLSCFQGGTVVQSLSSQDKFDAIRELIHKAPVFAGLRCQAELEEAVVQREKILSTGLGRGVAVAHGTTETIKDIIIALGISETGIDFDSFDKVPVHLLFVITNPPGRQMEYLVALSTVTRLMRDEAFRESLRSTALPWEIELKICQAFSECLDRYGGTSN
jgi:PTS system nitrogen regulatory IIA component